MKKIFLILSILFCSISNVYASTKVYTRTEENYLVPSDIEVTYGNKVDVLNTPAVDADEKIYDFADLLTDSEEQKLYDEINKYIEASRYDLAIVTIDENPKYSAMVYADDFFDYNDFGIGTNRDGTLILIDMDTRKIWISTSGAAIDKYSDSRIDSVIDAGYNELTSANYYDCLVNMVKKLESYHRMPYFVITLISAIICLVVSMILYNKTRSVIKKHNTVTYINTDNTNIIKNDMFVTTHTSRVLRQSSSSSGGSSTHRSSSGRSHGGGGRSF